MMATGGHSDAVLQELWLNLKYIHRDLRQGKDVDIYWALDIIRIMDMYEQFYSRGEYLRMRPFVLQKARELNVTPMFQVLCPEFDIR